MPDLRPPAPIGSPSWGNGYADSYAPVGLASLVQGFTQGMELGKEFDLKSKALEDSAAWRREMIGQRADANTIRQQMADIAQQKADKQFAPAGQPIEVPNLPPGQVAMTDGHGGIKIASTGKGGGDQEKALKAAAGAYSAMDDYQKIANSFLPESTIGGMAMAPIEWIRSKAMQTSPENNLADKAGQAATFYAAATNAGGGGRMSEAEIQNMAHAMGNKGIGETKGNISTKLEQMKDNLAAKAGVSREAVERYMQGNKSGGAAAAPGPIHTYSSGRKVQFNGKEWVPIQ